MSRKTRRIAINIGSGFVPGINAMLMGATAAAGELGGEVVGIRNGFDGLLYPDRYPDGGLVPLDARLLENVDPSGSALLGHSSRVDPFHVRRIDDDGMAEAADLSGQVLDKLQAEGIDALISVVGRRGLSILYKLHRKGLKTLCIPLSVENDIAATEVSFGFNTALSFTIEMLDRTRHAAQSTRQIGVVEVLGEESGWIALQAAIAVGADVVLIPEIRTDLREVAAHLQEGITAGRPHGLVVVATGATFTEEESRSDEKPSTLRASLSPNAEEGAGEHVIKRSGRAAKLVADRLQKLTAEETYPLVLGSWARGGVPTAVDRQLGICYGAAAVRAVIAGEDGAIVAFHPPDFESVPLAKAINQVRTVRRDSGLINVARSLGICVGGGRHE